MTNHDELRKLAEEATPGPWITYQGTIASAELVKRYTEARMSMFPALARAGLSSDQRFIAAANPTQVIALLDEIRVKDGEIDELITVDISAKDIELAQLRAELGATSRKLSEVEADLSERDGKLREVMAERDRIRAVLQVTAMRAYPEKSHEEIAAAIDADLNKQEKT